MAEKEGPWYVVIERDLVELIPNTKKWKWTSLPDYVVGPYPTKKDAERDGNGEQGIPYSLQTIDAKNEGYAATECYWTQMIPEKSIMITLPDDYVEEQIREEEEALKETTSCNHENTRTFTHHKEHTDKLPTQTICIDCGYLLRSQP